MDVSGNLADCLAIVDFDDFYREGNRLIFQAMLDLFHTGEPIEPITVIEQLIKSGTIDAAGGKEAVLDIVATPYIAASFRTYAELVHDTAMQRRLLQVGQSIEAIIAGREGETTDMLKQAEDLVYSLSQKTTRGDFEAAQTLVHANV